MKKAKVSQKDIAEHFGVTSGAFSQRLKTGKFNEDELKTIAEILGAKYFSGFEFPDGEKIFQKNLNILEKPIDNVLFIW